MEVDPYANDPSRWAHSLAHHAEIVLPCLDAVGARAVVEVGAYAGDLTRVLVQWARGPGARVWAIDPAPQDELLQLDRESDRLELVRALSLDALSQVPDCDAVIIDGDHNYYTVSQELRLIEERASGSRAPLILLHDVCWPHGRRDDYFAPEVIPDDYRQPIVEDGGLFPGEPGTVPYGLPYPKSAAREGGPRNGVRTAVEDFVASRDGLRLAIVPAFFGLGVVWHRDAPWAAAVADVLEPWDRNPMLEGLEANRVLHLASAHGQLVRAARLEAVVRRLVESSAFTVAERLSQLRRRAGIAPEQAVLSKDALRQALDGRG